MSYLVLARKWRPKNFSTLVGQEHIVRALTHALNEQRLHHAYLFAGTRGVGKTTLARILAKSLNCESGVSAIPCGQCASCQEIDAGRFVDLLEVDAATNTRVDEMRQLLENAVYVPTRGRFKIYVIDEVHMLSTSAFNAMLKTLEEPPEHVKFILATTDPQKIPVTVLSRCLQFNLKQMPQAAISGHLSRLLEAEEISFEIPALALISHAAAGSMRDALSLLDQAIAHGGGTIKTAEVETMLGTVASDYLYTILEALAAREPASMFKVAESMADRSLSFSVALQSLAQLLLQLQILQLAPEAIDANSVELPRLESLAQRFSPEFVQLAYQIVTQGRKELSQAPDEYGGFAMNLLRMYAFAPLTPGEMPTTLASPADRGEQPGDTIPDEPQPLASVQTDAASAATYENADWHEIASQLRLSGMAKAMAQHCELRQLDLAASRCKLALDPEHKHLHTENNQMRMQQALAELYGCTMRLKVELDAPTAQTPAGRSAELRTERQQTAEASIAADPFVREMIDECDARIADDSVRPL